MSNRVYNIGNLEYMATLPDGYFDLVIDDPQYGINVNMNMLGTLYVDMYATTTATTLDYYPVLYRDEQEPTPITPDKPNYPIIKQRIKKSPAIYKPIIYRRTVKTTKQPIRFMGWRQGR